ncbi:MAG: hypothetical protein RL021_1098 [Bacteroidota bacterium]|jgi:cytochrome c5
MKNSIIIYSLSFILFACGTAAQLYQPVEADVKNVTAKGTVTDLASLQQGYKLFEQHCTKCHGLTPPPRKSPEQWNHILSKMFPKTKMTEQEKTLVQNYILARR